MREQYRQEENCEIMHDSFIPRGLSDPYLIFLNGRLTGYGAIGNKYPQNRLTAFYTVPQMCLFALPYTQHAFAAAQWMAQASH